MSIDTGQYCCATHNTQPPTRNFRKSLHVSTKADALIRKAERGERVALIRHALEMTGDQFAVLIATRAAGYGLRVSYDKGKVSRLESGTRKVTVEEVAILTEIDPMCRSVAWLVFGPNEAAVTQQHAVAAATTDGEGKLAAIRARDAKERGKTDKKIAASKQTKPPTDVSDVPLKDAANE